MAVSHQSGVILHHWNDPPTTFTTKNKSASSSTVSLGLPTPPATPSIEGQDELVRGLSSLLQLSTSLAGRNKDMIFGRIRGLVKSIEDRKVTGMSFRMLETDLDSQKMVLKDILNDVEEGNKVTARERIVRLMSEERGIAAWGTALRMVIENLQL